MIRVTFPHPRQAPPAPWFVAYLENDEHYYVLRDDDPNFESQCFSSKWQARRAILSSLHKDTPDGK